MWRFPEDNTEPVITAEGHIHSSHSETVMKLPETAILFFLSKSADYLCKKYHAAELPVKLPRFLNRCPVWVIDDQICILNGGSGAPQACDTVETLAALGVKNIIAVGMFGAFDQRITAGEIIVPDKAFVEEGTSLHYYESIDYSSPDSSMSASCQSMLKIKSYPIVSTDAVYRQTFYKERMWREKGAVGVDMETSAVYSVSRYLGLKSVAILMASDLHPSNPKETKWEWKMTEDNRFEIAEKSLFIAKHL